jgi:hypothetical protein
MNGSAIAPRLTWVGVNLSEMNIVISDKQARYSSISGGSEAATFFYSVVFEDMVNNVIE